MKLKDTITITDILGGKGIIANLTKSNSSGSEQGSFLPKIDLGMLNDISMLDMNYYLHRSGNKKISPFLAKMLEYYKNNNNSLYDISQIIGTRFYTKWQSIFNALMAQYNPINNVNYSIEENINDTKKYEDTHTYQKDILTNGNEKTINKETVTKTETTLNSSSGNDNSNESENSQTNDSRELNKNSSELNNKTGINSKNNNENNITNEVIKGNSNSDSSIYGFNSPIPSPSDILQSTDARDTKTDNQKSFNENSNYNENENKTLTDSENEDKKLDSSKTTTKQNTTTNSFNGSKNSSDSVDGNNTLTKDDKIDEHLTEGLDYTLSNDGTRRKTTQGSVNVNYPSVIEKEVLLRVSNEFINYLFDDLDSMLVLSVY